MADNIASPDIGLSAPAKLNLYLHVLGKRGDGYHFLDSLVAFASLSDTLRFRPARPLQLSVSGPFAAALGEMPEAENIVLRAARRLAEFASVQQGAAIALTKNLPVAAGIGGGSADAAAALLGLARLWKLRIETEEMARLGLALGADVPVCLEGRATFVGGIGERLTPAAGLAPAGLLLVNPGLPLSTAAVFRAHGGRYSAAAPMAAVPADAEALAQFLSMRRNDLTEAAMGLLPAIGEVLEAIGQSNGCLLARMSGSGPTCFGLYRDQAAAEIAAASIRRGPGWWVAPGALLADGAVSG